MRSSMNHRLKKLEEIISGNDRDKIMILLDTTEETYIPDQQRKKPRLRINDQDFDVKDEEEAEKEIDKYLKTRKILRSSNRLFIFKICNISDRSFHESERWSGFKNKVRIALTN